LFNLLSGFLFFIIDIHDLIGWLILIGSTIMLSVSWHKQWRLSQWKHIKFSVSKTFDILIKIWSRFVEILSKKGTSTFLHNINTCATIMQQREAKTWYCFYCGEGGHNKQTCRHTQEKLLLNISMSIIKYLGVVYELQIVVVT
jgi:hypothetical protein